MNTIFATDAAAWRRPAKGAAHPPRGVLPWPVPAERRRICAAIGG